MKKLFSEADIKRRVEELAAQISKETFQSPLVAIGVLQGAFIFFSDVVRLLQLPVRCEFLGVNRFDRRPQSKEVRLLLDVDAPIQGQDVLLIDDIVETGLTLQFVQNTLLARRPRLLRTCALVVKKGQQKARVGLDYIGFEIDNLFVVGYGNDYHGKFRELPYIGVLESNRA